MTVIGENTVMVAEGASYSLNELTERVAHLLDERGLTGVQQDQRVSAAPDKRTIRYYTTLGLLDRPKIEGRQAKYSDRHVLQILAIKSLQGVSLPLAEIQSLLLGSTDAELRHVVENVAESVKVKEKLTKRESMQVRSLIELDLAPGLKIVAERDWESSMSKELLLDRFRAALDELSNNKTQF